MRLRRQLILVSLLTLSLPWAGCQYIQEMEGALRQGQVIALTASAQAVADRIRSDPHLMNELDQSAHRVAAASQMYVHPLTAPVILDGYDDDWRYLELQSHELRDSVNHLRFTVGRWDHKLFLFIQVDDQNITYHNPAKSVLSSGDHLILRSRVKYGVKWYSRDYVIRSGAPGNITGYYQDVFNGQPQNSRDEPLIRGYWQERQGGYQVELELPESLLDGYLALGVVNVDGDIEHPWLGTVAEREWAPPLVTRSQTLTAAIAIFAHNDLRLRVVSQNQWLIAQSGQLKADRAAVASGSHGLLAWIYRMALGYELLPALDDPEVSGRFNAREVTQALSGEPASQWYQWGSRRVGRAAVPLLFSDQQPTAVVIAEQSTDALLALTNNAFNRLFFYSVLASVLAGAGLLAYASWLSFRIRRLNRAADNAIGENGQIIVNFPQSTAADEVGDLTRSYAQLLGRLHEYTDYLRTLSSKLSHELRTPLAVIRTSLDNLEHENLNATATTYTQRAQEGASRLSTILNAMSSASRVEESIQQAEKEWIPLPQLLRDVGQAYQDVYPHVSLRVVIEPSVTQQQLYGVGELVVQMLDKLVDNAADFCPAGAEIVLTLQQSSQHLILSVSNDGPLLPEHMHSQLFDSLVSIRDHQPPGGAADISHLGLGLHIVRIIAEFHQATVTASNRDDGSGVIFAIKFPLK